MEGRKSVGVVVVVVEEKFYNFNAAVSCQNLVESNLDGLKVVATQ